MSALEELSEEARRETLLIDCTTLDQSVAKEVARRMKAMGAEMIDAPVSGGTSVFLLDLVEKSGISKLMLARVHDMPQVLWELNRALCHSCAVDPRKRTSLYPVRHSVPFTHAGDKTSGSSERNLISP